MQRGVVVPKLLLWQKHHEVAGSASCKSRMMCRDNFLALATIFGDRSKKSMRYALKILKSPANNESKRSKWHISGAFPTMTVQPLQWSVNIIMINAAYPRISRHPNLDSHTCLNSSLLKNLSSDRRCAVNGLGNWQLTRSRFGCCSTAAYCQLPTFVITLLVLYYCSIV